MRAAVSARRRGLLGGGRVGCGAAARRTRPLGGTLGMEPLEGRRVLAASYIYGIDEYNNIQQVSTGSQSYVTVYNNANGGTIPAGLSNAFAYDTARDQFFFIDSGKNLEFWNRSGNPKQIASAADLGISGVTQPANAAYYADAYWFFNEGTNSLVRVPLLYTDPADPKVDKLNVTPYVVPGAPTVNPNGNFFGDIAIDIPNGILYAATTSGQFYSVNLNILATDPDNAYKSFPLTTPNPSLQLSFNSDYSKLYAQLFNDGQWYTIDNLTPNTLNAGVATPIPGFAITYPDPNNAAAPRFGLRDLGGAADEPAPSLAIKKDADVQTVFAGDGVIHSYTITVTNKGQVEATGVKLTDSWPNGFTQLQDSFVRTPNVGVLTTNTPNPNDFVWDIGTMAAGAIVTLQVSYTVPFSAAFDAGKTQFTNTATVTSPTDPEIRTDFVTNTVVTNALVAANDIGCLSTPFVNVINPYSGTPADPGNNVGVSNEVYKRFNAYQEYQGFRGGVRVAVGDVDGDGIPDIVTAPGPGVPGAVKVFKLDGSPKTNFIPQPYYPFGTGYRDGVEINLGDIDGDGDDDLIAAKSRGAGEVQVAKSEKTDYPPPPPPAPPIPPTWAFVPFKSFTAFGGTYQGGATAAIGSRTNGTVALVVGSGIGMKPTVKNYNLNWTDGTLTSAGQFYPAVPTTTAGVSVTTQRFTGNALDTLVAAGRNGNSKVSAYQALNNAAIPSRSYSTFSAPAPKYNTPVYAAASALAASTVVDTVFMAQGAGGVGTIKKVNATNGNVNADFAPFYLVNNVRTPVVSPLRIATNTRRLLT